MTLHHIDTSDCICVMRESWSLTNWRYVIFICESRFTVSVDHGCTQMQRQQGQGSYQAFVAELHLSITQGESMQKRTCFDTRSPLVLLQSTMTSCTYMDSILTMVMLPICQLAQVSFSSKITLVHTLHDSPNDFYKDITCSHSLPDHQTSRQQSMCGT